MRKLVLLVMDGSVSAVALPLAPGVKPIEFTRKPALAPEVESKSEQA
jgi:hypothetical protein